MAGLLDVLGVGARGIAAQEAGLAAVTHNVSNVGTPGFHRRDLVLGPLSPMRGVEVLGARRAVDAELQRSVLDQAARWGYADARRPLVSEIEGAVGDLGDTGLGAAIDEMFAAWSALAASPEDVALRGAVLARADAVAATAGRVARDLAAVQASADARLRAALPEANRLMADVATLNREIRVTEAGGGDAGDLRDRRDLAVRDLAELVGARALDDGSGGVILLLGGLRVVQDDRAETLVAEPDATSGLARVRIAGPPREDVTAALGGRAGAYVGVRDGAVPTRLAALDQVVFDLVSAVNAVHAAGYGLDGATGRNLFAPLVAPAGAAAAMAVDPAVAGDPAALAASESAATLPGDGRNALDLAAIAGQAVALGGTATLSEAVGALLQGVGEDARAGEQNFLREDDRLAGLQALAEQVSGVDLDEQLALMSRYQRAYEASARVVATVDQMLETLLAIKR